MKRAPTILASLVLIAAAVIALKPGSQPPGDAVGIDASTPSSQSTPSTASTTSPVLAIPDAPPPVATADASHPPTEEELTLRLRALVDARPEEALALAAEAERAFPTGRLADERSFLVMRALVHLDRIGAAREAASDFHHRFPDSPWAEQVVQLTGYQPRKYGPKR
ncbi:MAG: hypothetical protein QM765_10025 [Myxococcales bacterium]